MLVILWSLGSNFYKFLSSPKAADQTLLTDDSHLPPTATVFNSTSSSHFEKSCATC